MNEIEKPQVYYSAPYHVKGQKAAWKVDKYAHGKRQQVIDFWQESLAWQFLETITVTITNKNK